MRYRALSGRVGKAFVLAGICSFLAAAAHAAEALYSVDWVDGHPPRVRVKIDTNPWSEGTKSPDAKLSLTIIAGNQAPQKLDIDFLDGLSGVHFRQGEVYERLFPVRINGATGFSKSLLHFPNLTGKADGGGQKVAGTPGVTTVTLPERAESVVVASPSAPIMSMQPAVNRNGGDFNEERLSSAQQCSDRCLRDRQCLAFTFVRDDQGGVCWLKSSVPASTQCSRCVSGVKQTMSWEPRVDRTGSDLRNQAMSSAQSCSDLCLRTSQCAAFTFVGGAQGGTCWLKNAVPSRSECSNCVSGVKRPP